jgi:hypothetical protein
LLALKELQVEMEFQDQAIGQRGQRLHGGTGLGEIGGMLDLIDAADCRSFELLGQDWE